MNKPQSHLNKQRMETSVRALTEVGATSPKGGDTVVFKGGGAEKEVAQSRHLAHPVVTIVTLGSKELVVVDINHLEGASEVLDLGGKVSCEVVGE